MWTMFAVLMATTLTSVLGIGYHRLSPEDYKTLARLHTPRASLGAGFKYKYVSSDGSIHNSRPSGHSIEVAASPKTGATAHYDAALIISHQTRNMPSSVFTSLANRASVGVFTRTETMSVYPEYYSLRDTAQCHGTCAGHCSVTCTFDGRKWSVTAGAGGKRAVILDDNVSCSSRDPYHHHENILIHEFSHTVHHYGLDSAHDSQIRTAYNHAKAANLWRLSSYAMANYEEYFAEGATSYFNVNQQTSAGGMNQCHGSSYCTSEMAARNWIYQHDRQLYNILTYAFTNNRPSLPSHLSVCQKV